MPNLIFRLNVSATLRAMKIGEELELFREDVDVEAVRSAASRLKPMVFTVNKNNGVIKVFRKS